MKSGFMYHWAIFDPILNLFWQNAIVVNGKMKKSLAIRSHWLGQKFKDHSRLVQTRRNQLRASKTRRSEKLEEFLRSVIELDSQQYRVLDRYSLAVR